VLYDALRRLRRAERDHARTATRPENLEGGAEEFPHIYGTLPVDAVVAVLAVRASVDGTFTVDGLASGFAGVRSMEQLFDTE
jgi:hypothetical protein